MQFLSPVKNIPHIHHHWNSSLFSSMHSLQGPNFPPFPIFKSLFPLHHLPLSVSPSLPHFKLCYLFLLKIRQPMQCSKWKLSLFFFQYSMYCKAWRQYLLSHFSCLTLCNLMDSSLPGSSVHEIFLARILEWVVTSSSSGPCWPRDQTRVSCIAGGFIFF